MAKRNLLAASVGISLGCFAVLVIITPLLIIFRWFGVLSITVVPDWLIIVMVFTTILYGAVINREFFWNHD